MRLRPAALALTLLLVPGLAATRPAPARAAEDDFEDRSGAGVEVDGVPFATGGFSVSVWSGRGAWRVRPVISRFYPLSFVTPDGFDGARVDAMALLLDWFPRRGERAYRGLRVGAGVEYWRSVIARAGFAGYSTFTNTLVTAGGGYVLPAWRNSYHEPAVAGHLVVAGGRDIPVSGAEYRQRAFTPEVSLKLGLSF